MQLHHLDAAAMKVRLSPFRALVCIAHLRAFWARLAGLTHLQPLDPAELQGSSKLYGATLSSWKDRIRV